MVSSQVDSRSVSPSVESTEELAAIEEMEMVSMLNGEMSKLRLMLAEKDERIAEISLEREALRLRAEEAERRMLEKEREVALERVRMHRKSSK